MNIHKATDLARLRAQRGRSSCPRMRTEIHDGGSAHHKQRLKWCRSRVSKRPLVGDLVQRKTDNQTIELAKEYFSSEPKSYDNHKLNLVGGDG